MELRRVSIEGVKANANIAVIDPRTHKLVFLSMIGSDSAIKRILKEANKRNSISIERMGSYGTSYKEYDALTDRDNLTGYTTAILSIKDKAEVLAGNEVRLTGYIYAEAGEEFQLSRLLEDEYEQAAGFIDALYNKIYAHMPTPMIPEWKNYLAKEVVRANFIQELRTFKQASDTLRVFRFHATSNDITRILQGGLALGELSIKETNSISEQLDEISGMNDYLTSYSVQSANKLHETFQAKFTPNVSSYDDELETLSDYLSYKHKINLYEPQKIVIQASVNNLNKNDVTFVIAEPGSGKTLIGSAIVYAHAKRFGTTNIVLSPGHLVEKWVSEIHRAVPLSKALVVNDFEHFKALEPMINDPKRKHSLFLVMSKDMAKSTYEKRPAVIWSDHRNAYTCPTCGGTLQKKTYVGSGRMKREVWVDLTELDFLKEYAYNAKCENMVRKWDGQRKDYDEVKCHSNLWTPSIKDDSARWIRLSKGNGWVEKRHLINLRTRIDAEQTPTRQQKSMRQSIVEALTHQTPQRAPRKYSLANYIRRFYAGKIDYLIADELQKYKGGNSMQGQAFGDLIQASKKTICLTGTLLNGYADSLFYILYRSFPRMMKKAGFDYADEKEFARMYGVVRYDDRFNTSGAGNQTTRIGSRREKFLPGVSPLVFTKFLLENAVFLNLQDISDSLPEYEEIPIGVDMEPDLGEAYREIEGAFRSRMGRGRGNQNGNLMGTMLQTLSAYPDMPYGQEPIRNFETEEVLFTCPSLDADTVRNKQRELLRICRERVAAGEKVLVYYHWSNRSDVETKLPELLNQAGLRTTLLKSNSSNIREREAWIAERTPDTDVLLCNPTLVETGLDLLDYTSIIFYQVGYDIFTMRQASKRSYRLNQKKNVKVYFLYYTNTIQEQALGLMATKLQASQAIEGNFSEEGLHALSQNEDLLTQIANAVVQGISHSIDINVFAGTKERQVHSNPEASFSDTFDLLLDDEDFVVPVQEEVVEEYVSFIKPTSYVLRKEVPRKAKRKKAPSISAQSANTAHLLKELRSKHIHLINLAL